MALRFELCYGSFALILDMIFESSNQVNVDSQSSQALRSGPLQLQDMSRQDMYKQTTIYLVIEV